MKMIPRLDDFTELRSFVKMVLILSHVNAFVEQGFSVNKEILVENLSEISLVAQRRTYDGLMYHGGDIRTFEITKSLIHSFQNAHSIYKEALEKRR